MNIVVLKFHFNDEKKLLNGAFMRLKLFILIIICPIIENEGFWKVAKDTATAREGQSIGTT